jgi:hypothetical protein
MRGELLSDPHLPMDWYMSIADCCEKHDVLLERNGCTLDWGKERIVFGGHYGSLPLTVFVYRLARERSVVVIACPGRSAWPFFHAVWNADAMAFTEVIGPQVGDYLRRGEVI